METEESKTKSYNQHKTKIELKFIIYICKYTC